MNLLFQDGLHGGIRKSLNLQLLSSGMFLGATRSRNWLFATSVQNLRPRNPPVPSFKVFLSSCYRMCPNIPVYTKNSLLYRKVGNIHIFNLIYDDEMPSILSNQSKTENLTTWIYIFKVQFMQIMRNLYKGELRTWINSLINLCSSGGEYVWPVEAGFGELVWLLNDYPWVYVLSVVWLISFVLHAMLHSLCREA